MPWLHAICLPCWKKLNPTKTPRINYGRELEGCCFCGAQTMDGIFVDELQPLPQPVCRGTWCWVDPL